MHVPLELHYNAAIVILQYLRRFPSLGLWYPAGKELILRGFLDSNYGGDMDERMSTGAYIFTLGKTPISWSSKKQNVTSRSSYESKSRALAKATCEAVWLRRLIHELGLGDRKPTTV